MGQELITHPQIKGGQPQIFGTQPQLLTCKNLIINSRHLLLPVHQSGPYVPMHVGTNTSFHRVLATLRGIRFGSRNHERYDGLAVWVGLGD